jgi:hypothetical protein
MTTHGGDTQLKPSPLEMVTFVLYGALLCITLLLTLIYFQHYAASVKAHAAQRAASVMPSCASKDAAVPAPSPTPGDQASRPATALPASHSETHAAKPVVQERRHTDQQPLHDADAAAEPSSLSLTWQHVWQGGGALWNSIHTSEDDVHHHFPACLEQEHAFLLRLLDDRLHAKQTREVSLFKTWIVLFISALWFCTFLTANHATQWWNRVGWAIFSPRFGHVRENLATGTRTRRPGMDARSSHQDHAGAGEVINARRVIKVSLTIFSIVPVAPFMVAMHQEYEPAVFVMALVAIFVAAEHYGGLTETEHDLRDSTRQLQQRLSIVLDADGLNEWRTEVYQLYSTAKYRIDAVIRSFDIDELWWKCANEEDPWETYRNACLHDNATLLFNLRQSKADVQFVADLPMRARLPPEYPEKFCKRPVLS